VLFYSQVDGPSLRLGNIRITEWDVRLAPEPPPDHVVTNDTVRLANRDVAIGHVRDLGSGKLGIATLDTKLEIPLDRITQIFLANTVAPAAQRGEVRAQFSHGGSLAFHLEGWTGQAVTGTSAQFGKVALRPESIRQVSFNLERTPRAEDADDTPTAIRWDLEE
jgi:hypothetical protein